MRRLLGRKLPEEIKTRVEEWEAAPAPTLEEAWEPLPIAVVDVETTGLSTLHDHLLSIGAVFVVGGAIQLGNVFHEILRPERIGSRENVLLHGITHAMQEEGVPPLGMLTDFLEFTGKSPLVAFHAAFDRAFLRRAIKRHLGLRFKNTFVDLAWVLPGLFPEIAPAPQGLDGWLEQFGIPAHHRHSAEEDALVTAELFLIALARAREREILTFQGLAELARHEEQLHVPLSRRMH